MEKIYVKKKEVYKESSDELTFVNKKHFGWEDYDTHEYIEIDIMNGYTEPINIDTLLQMLQAAKDEGATHVNVWYHDGHESLYVRGIEMRLATQEEIDKYKTRRKELKELDQDMNRLNNELGRLAEKRMSILRKNR